MSDVQWVFESSVGPIYLVASDKGLKGLFWRKPSVPQLASLAGDDAPTRVIRETIAQLKEYFAHKRTSFDVPLDVDGTAFQKRVWAELSRIPYGKTVSYSDIARKINQAKAVRAVGTANGRNPVSIIVPCHRVIAADGTLGGYAGGLSAKTKLLALEQSRQT